MCLCPLSHPRVQLGDLFVIRSGNATAIKDLWVSVRKHNLSIPECNTHPNVDASFVTMTRPSACPCAGHPNNKHVQEKGDSTLGYQTRDPRQVAVFKFRMNAGPPESCSNPRPP